MHADRIDQQAERPLTRGAAGVDGPEEGILDPDQRTSAPRGHTLATPGRGAATPDDDAIAGTGQAQAQFMSKKLEDPSHPPIARQRQVLMPEPLGYSGQSGARPLTGHGGVRCRNWWSRPGSPPPRSSR